MHEKIPGWRAKVSGRKCSGEKVFGKKVSNLKSENGFACVSNKKNEFLSGKGAGWGKERIRRRREKKERKTGVKRLKVRRRLPACNDPNGRRRFKRLFHCHL